MKRAFLDSFRIPCQRVRVDQEKKLVSLPKVGWVKYRKSREIIGDLKNATISLNQGKWYISFNTEQTVPDPIHPSDIKSTIVLNNVDSVHLSSGGGGDNTYQAEEKKKLIRLNKTLTRRKKHSQNWLKTKGKIGRVK